MRAGASSVGMCGCFRGVWGCVIHVLALGHV
jgi:hypothetical protein